MYHTLLQSIALLHQEEAANQVSPSIFKLDILPLSGSYKAASQQIKLCLGVSVVWPFHLLHDAAGSQLVALHFLHLTLNMSLEKKNNVWKVHNAFLYNSRTAGSGLSGASKQTNEMKEQFHLFVSQGTQKTIAQGSGDRY